MEPGKDPFLSRLHSGRLLTVETRVEMTNSEKHTRIIQNRQFHTSLVFAGKAKS